jgi:hypothetical protein
VTVRMVAQVSLGVMVIAVDLIRPDGPGMRTGTNGPQGRA